MRLNSRGQAVLGVGDGVVSIDGQAIGRGGGANWLTDETVVAVIAEMDGWKIRTYAAATRRWAKVSERGANELYADGGRWAAWLAGVGVFTSDGLSLPDAGLLDVGRDGTIAIVPNRQVGRGLAIIPPGAREPVILDTTTIPFGVRVFSQTTLAWTEAGRLRTIGTPTPVPIAGETVFNPRLLPLKGQWWVCYHTHTRLVVRPVTDVRGYVVVDAPTAFNPDAVALADATIRIGWSYRQGELPEDFGIAPINPAQQAPIDLRVEPVPPSPPNPPPPDPGHPTPPKEPPVSDRSAVVEKWKEAVERAGIPVTGSIEGAHQVARRVAWELRDEGIGLLIKRDGENIVYWRGESYSAGRVAYKKDGRTYPIKIFTDVPATNNPKWDVGTEPVPNDQFWAEAQEPDPLGTPEDPEEPTPPEPFPDPQLLALVDSIKALAATLDAVGQEVADTYDRVEALDAQIREIARRLGEVQEQQYQALDGRVPVFGGTVVLTPRRAK